jgi:predicted DNA-binding transcriptional regulator AlpA
MSTKKFKPEALEPKPARRWERRRQMIEQARENARASAVATGQRRILRIADVEIATSLPRSAIYDGAANGWFPPPVPITERSRGWLSDEVEQWVAQRIAARKTSKQTEPA